MGVIDICYGLAPGVVMMWCFGPDPLLRPGYQVPVLHVLLWSGYQHSGLGQHNGGRVVASA